MTIELKPEEEDLIQKLLLSGEFSNEQDVIHRALQAQAAEAAWLEQHKREVGEKIERAIAEFDDGGGIPASQVRGRLQEMKMGKPARGK
jgi:Arc/MetJ-type ribon-helix-helix transcriptional regulator